jgi:hypothetical protein
MVVAPQSVRSIGRASCTARGRSRELLDRPLPTTPKGGRMITERIAPVEDPGLALRGFYAIGRRLFGDVPTPQKLMAHRPALMFGIGALWTSIERFGTLDARLRALLQLHVARLYDVAY